jgi:hypothetical protein
MNMAATPISAVLQGTLTGATAQGALTPIPLAYQLSAQGGHQQNNIQVEAGETKPVILPTNLAGPVASPNPQTMLLVTCDVGGVNITLNSLGVPVGPFNFTKPGGVLLIPGRINSLPVSDLSINNTGTQRATVSVTVVYGL